MTDFVTFKDFNFKLAVVQQLMYEKNIIKPRFDLYKFSQKHKARQIDIEEEGYDIIPEAKQFFEQLAVPASALPLITEIYQDGGDAIYGELYPFWDGEDDIFNILSADDADLLPNLKKITLFYGDDKTILQAFQQRGIEAEWL